MIIPGNYYRVPYRLILHTYKSISAILYDKFLEITVEGPPANWLYRPAYISLNSAIGLLWDILKHIATELKPTESTSQIMNKDKVLQPMP